MAFGGRPMRRTFVRRRGGKARGRHMGWHRGADRRTVGDEARTAALFRKPYLPAPLDAH